MRLGILVHVHISLGCAKIQGKETKSKYLERPMHAHTFENMHACTHDCTRVASHFTYSHKKLSVLPACVYAHMPIYGSMMVIEFSPPSLPCRMSKLFRHPLLDSKQLSDENRENLAPGIALPCCLPDSGGPIDAAAAKRGCCCIDGTTRVRESARQSNAWSKVLSVFI